MRQFKYLSIFVTALIFISCSTESTPEYLLTISSEPPEAGIVSPSQMHVEEGQNVTIKATPNEHWVFQSWGGDYSGVENPASVIMDRDKSISAIFTKRDYPLTVNTIGSGNVYERVVQAKSTEYMHGTLVELGANAHAGWKFTGWSGSIQDSDDIILIAIDGETTITATFEKVEVDFNGVRFSRSDSGGYYRLKQYGVSLNPNKTYRLSASFLVNQYRFGPSDHFEIVGNGKWYQPINHDIQYFPDGTAIFTGDYEVDFQTDYTVQVSMWGADSMISTGISLVDIDKNLELLRNGTFSNGINEWATDGKPLEWITEKPPALSSIDGYHLTYYRFDGEPEDLLAVEGTNVMLFVPFDTQYSRQHLNNFANRIDKSWNYFIEITGREPITQPVRLNVNDFTINYREKPTLAVVESTCGAGCGYVGSTGIELHKDLWPVTIERHMNNEETRGIFEYEMGRNFWFYGDRLQPSELPEYHLANAFATIFGYKAGVAGGSTTQPGNELVDWVQSYQDSFNEYLTNPDFNILTQGGQPAEKIHGGLWLYMSDEYGEGFYRRFFEDVYKKPNAATIEDAVLNFVLASCHAAETDLGRWFAESLNYPVNENACQN